MNEIFAFIFLVIVPILYIGGPNGFREILTITAAAVYWLIVLWTGLPILVAPLPVLLFCGWLLTSVLWSKNKDAIWGVIIIISCFTAYQIFQHVDRLHILFMLFLPAPGIAITMLWEKWKIRKTDLRPGGIFGNCNHVGVYLSITLLIGVWLALNVTYWLAPFILCCLAAIFYSRSSNAQTSTLLGICSLFAFHGEWMLFFLFIAGFTAIAFCMPDKRDKYNGRIILFKKAYNLIKKKPLFGWGVNSFAVEHCYIKDYDVTHRVHNDFLELWHEIGIIGLALFGFIYWSADWKIDPLFSAQLIITLATAFWFFTYREMHTFLPVLALLAALTPATGNFFTFYLPAVVIITLGIIAVFYYQVVKKALGVYWYIRASRQKTRELQYKYITKALKYDVNSIYLTRAAYLTALGKDYHGAWQMIHEAVYNFDGKVTLVSLYLQAAKASMLLGAIGIADMFVRLSLELHPTYPDSLALSKEINKILDQMKGAIE